MSGEQNPGEIWETDSVIMIRNAKALQRVVKELEKNKSKPSDGWGKWDRGTEDQSLFLGRLLAVPNLLSLATEIALKAWLCSERQTAPERTHNLLKLFESLEQNTQEMLEARMRKVSPHSVWAGQPGMQNLGPFEQEMFAAKMHPLRDVLRSHSDANMRWRYLHEQTSSQQFETAEIDRALTVLTAPTDRLTTGPSVWDTLDL